MEKAPVRVQAHLPERHRPDTVTLPCGCCCCCCCCLHTIGGLIGAAVGSSLAAKQEYRSIPYQYEQDDEYSDLPPRPRPSAVSPQAIYWLTFLGLAGLTALVSCTGVYGLLFNGAQARPDPAAGILILAIFLPAVQLAASVIAIPLAGLTDRDNAAARIWAIGKITLCFLIGTGIGIGVMSVTCFGLGWMR